MTSYSLRLVVTWLNSKGMTYEFSSPRTGTLCDTGLITPLQGDFTLSIQTHPLIVIDKFAETALLYKGKLCYTHDWDYYDTRTYDTPDALFAHIDDLRQRLKDYIPFTDKGVFKGFRLRDGIEVIRA